MISWRAGTVGLALVAGACSEVPKEEAATGIAADAAAQPAAAGPAPAPLAATASPAAAAPDAQGALVARFLDLKPGAQPPPAGPGQTLPGDVKGGSDHPAVPRYEGARITHYRQKQFEAAPLWLAAVADAGDAQAASQMLEGRVTDVRYEAPADRSALELFRNYQAALKDAGFETVFSCDGDACGRTASLMANSVAMTSFTGQSRHFLAAFRPSDGIRLNLAAWNFVGSPPNVDLRVVEPRAMEQRVKIVDAAGIGRDVAGQGRALLYAIRFETDKATLKPESDAQLAEIAAWLKGSKTKALVVGHTDSAGAFPYNVGLSQRRAEAVVAALTSRYAVPRAQLTAFGNGMAAPVASNRSPDGQARNRRVEVVEMVS